MNIFATDANPTTSARALDDSRVGKMILESAQMLCTVLSIQAPGLILPYKPVHQNHPATLWVKSSRVNAGWLWHHGDSLGREFLHRFGKRHASSAVIDQLYFLIEPTVKPRPVDFYNGSRHLGLGIDFSHLPVHYAYKQYLLERWRTGSRPPRWTRRPPPDWSPYS